jgi:hypothetical protein
MKRTLALLSTMKANAIYAATVLAIAILFGAPTIASAQKIPKNAQSGLDAWDVIIPDGAKRFVVLEDFDFDAVLDRETGLVWEKEPSPGGRSWQDAQAHCTLLFKGGRGGWRLPTIQELTSLKTTPSFNPPLPADHPFVFERTDYWSATSSATERTPGFPGAWVFSPGGDGAINVDEKDDPNGVRDGNIEGAWCVRFRQGVNPQ